jgi:hypothetical protein
MFINQYYNFWFDEFTVLVIATVKKFGLFTSSSSLDLCLHFIVDFLREHLLAVLRLPEHLLLQNPTA